jgi:hypothetical protein
MVIQKSFAALLAWAPIAINIPSASRNSSIRQWTRNEEPVGRPWNGDGRAVGSMAIFPDKSMVVSGSSNGRLQLWDIRRGMNVQWGALIDHPIRPWNLDTGRQIASPIEVPAGRKTNVSGSPMPLFGIIYLQRIFVFPPTAAEVARVEAAAAIQYANSNETGSSTQAGQPQAVPGTQVSQGRSTDTQGAGGGTAEI